MPADVSIVIADVKRLAAIRQDLPLPGRPMYFTAANLSLAIENIRSYQPKLIAIDAQFAQTPPGVAFVDRVERLAIGGVDIRLITRGESGWIALSRDVGPAIGAAAAPAIVAAAGLPVVATNAAALNTRRAPRFLVRDPLSAVVENGSASLVDISVLGAQVVSRPTLRPNQKIKLALPDIDDMLQVTAHVAWSTFEKPQPDVEPHYRAGLEFRDAAQQALEDYRRRHCADQPIPHRSSLK